MIGPNTAGALEVAERDGDEPTNTVLTIVCDGDSRFFATIAD
ncbi:MULTISPECIES: hypothetical protein [Natrialbaceae]|nr:hypothetical protein [Natronococcus sp. CG52]